MFWWIWAAEIQLAGMAIAAFALLRITEPEDDEEWSEVSNAYAGLVVLLFILVWPYAFWFFLRTRSRARKI